MINPIPPALDFPPSVTVHGQNTQCVTMVKIRGAAGDRVQLLQVPRVVTCASAMHTPSRCRQEPSLSQPRRKDADTTQTIAFGSRWLLLFRYCAVMNERCRRNLHHRVAAAPKLAAAAGGALDESGGGGAVSAAPPTRGTPFLLDSVRNQQVRLMKPPGCCCGCVPSIQMYNGFFAVACWLGSARCRGGSGSRCVCIAEKQICRGYPRGACRPAHSFSRASLQVLPQNFVHAH